ncbi:MAG TPA: sugar phosphate nucleotidyltransferase [Gaiellaceae bacterium]|jgi:molybdopterin-guanine dinucleotide biosynthesis protein A|nr:sugar phosphate nucleotidyltransferase [Gaiellaceae bacterium]
MQPVILAGGFGTRISEESAVRPKPMVEIGGKPILWHVVRSRATGDDHPSLRSRAAAQGQEGSVSGPFR